MSASPRQPFAFDVIKRFIRFLFGLVMHLDIQGAERIPQHGPAILTPNHTSWLDLPLIALISTGVVTVFAAEKWEKVPVLGHILRYYGHAIFVYRGHVDRAALRKAVQVLKNGGVLGLAPEGTRSHDGVLQKGRDGAAWLAGRTGALLVPIAVWGHENVTGQWVRLRRPHVHVHVGQPYRLPPEASEARSHELDPYTELIMRKIAVMLPPEQRGPYA